MGDWRLVIGLSFCFAPQMRHGCISLEQKQNITTRFLYIFVAFKEGVFLLKKLTIIDNIIDKKLFKKSVKCRV